MGVLDMQATQPHTFSDQNVTTFEAMATQLAISIDSAEQWTLSQEAQRKAEQALRQLTREAWSDHLAVRRGQVGFAYDLTAIKPVEADGQNGGVSVPLLVQDESIGHLTVTPATSQALTEDEQGLLSAVAEQLAQKAETIRLFEVTQQRASREQIARQITDRLRSSRDIKSALQTAAEELSKALGTSRAVVDLKMGAEPEPEAAPLDVASEDK
jgi:GAF domain-containing protein